MFAHRKHKKELCAFRFSTGIQVNFLLAFHSHSSLVFTVHVFAFEVNLLCADRFSIAKTKGKHKHNNCSILLFVTLFFFTCLLQFSNYSLIHSLIHLPVFIWVYSLLTAPTPVCGENCQRWNLGRKGGNIMHGVGTGLRRRNMRNPFP